MLRTVQYQCTGTHEKNMHIVHGRFFFVCSPVSSRIYLLCYLTSNRILNWIVALSLPLLHASTTGMTIIIIILLAFRMMFDIQIRQITSQPIPIHFEKSLFHLELLFACDWCEKELIQKVVWAQMKSERNDNYFCVCDVRVLLKAVAKYFSGKMTRSYLIWTVIHK